MSCFVVTVDGPSGAGKGTICQLLAKSLNYRLLDSGALYRLTGLSASNQGLDFEDRAALKQCAAQLDAEFLPSDTGVAVMLDGINVSRDIRTEAAGMNASKVAAVDEVRDALLQRQRDFAEGVGLVADGRDMGTTVFPEAPVKIFLTASAEERAQRRQRQLEQSGEVADYVKILEDIKKRDEQDSNRSSSPLKPAEDAVVLDSTNMTIEEVEAYIKQLIASKLS